LASEGVEADRTILVLLALLLVGRELRDQVAFD
jgi:hypothetical protein